jgi:ketosteroid isomerase-like protein
MDDTTLPPGLGDFLSSFWEAFARAESTGDFTEVAPMCADDLVFMSPSEEPYETLASLVEAWWTPPPSYRITFDRSETVATDTLAIQRGIASDSFVRDGETRGHRYNYLAVFGTRDDGWLLTHFVSNMID